MGGMTIKPSTVDGFLVWDGEGDTRYELIRGQVFAMDVASAVHGAIVVNAATAIQLPLRPRFKTLLGAGIIPAWRNDTYFHSDVSVTDAPIRPDSWGAPNPIMIVEVVSPSTAVRDRGIKLSDYREIESAREILLIESEQQHVEHWRRDGADWIVGNFGIGDRLRLPSLDLEIPVERLYYGLACLSGDAARC
jgi:Uma2 family endonuclease